MNLKLFNIAILCFSFFVVNAQKDIKEAEKMAKSEFKKMPKHELDEIKMTEKQYVDLKITKYKELQAFYAKISSQKSASNLCSNGDFESGQIIESEWNAYWSGVLKDGMVQGNGSSLITSGSFEQTTAIIQHNNQVHHQVVQHGDDPTYPAMLKTTDGLSNKFSLRLGNKFIGSGYESVSKKILVTKSNSFLQFSYATVLNDAGHTGSENPGFGVKIKEVITGIERNNLINLGNGLNIITSDNPLLITGDKPKVKYKKWSCVSIDMSSLIGKEVIIEFFNRDCTMTGHWGYSYVDNICLGCQNPHDPEGNVVINLGKTDTCGVGGKICVNYTLPSAPNPSMIIDLKITQNGVVKKTLTSPNFTSNGSYCFTISQSDLNMLDATFGGFDYHIIGKPKSGSFIFPNKTFGNLSTGINDKKLDYKIQCKSTPPPPPLSTCCPPMLQKDIYPLFTPIFSGGSSGPYKMQFSLPQNIKDAMQSYINLLKFTCGAKQLIVNWQLCEVVGTGCNILETKSVVFTAGSSSTPIPAFFTTILQQDKKYKISVIYKYDGQKCFDQRCDDELNKPFEWDIDKKSGTIINKPN